MSLELRKLKEYGLVSVDMRSSEETLKGDCLSGTDQSFVDVDVLGKAFGGAEPI